MTKRRTLPAKAKPAPKAPAKRRGGYWLNPGYYPIFICYCPNKEAWDYEVRKMKAPAPYPAKPGFAQQSTFTNPRGKPVYIITTDSLNPDDPNGVVALLAHEVVHIWQATKKHIGEECPGEEQEAYFVQFVLGYLLDVYTLAHGPLTLRVPNP